MAIIDKNDVIVAAISKEGKLICDNDFLSIALEQPLLVIESL